MLAVLHSIESYRYVVVPVCCNVNQVDIVALAQLLVTFRTAVDISCWQTSLLNDIFVYTFSTCFFVVAKCYDLYIQTNIFHVSETLYGTWSAHTQTNESNTYGLQSWSLQFQNIFLTLFAFWNDCTDNTVFSAFPFSSKVVIQGRFIAFIGSRSALYRTPGKHHSKSTSQ